MADSIPRGSMTKQKRKIGDVAKTLFDEDGVFELTAPGGDVFQVRCQRGVGMAFTRIGGAARGNAQNTRWQIRRRSAEL